MKQIFTELPATGVGVGVGVAVGGGVGVGVDVDVGVGVGVLRGLAAKADPGRSNAATTAADVINFELIDTLLHWLLEQRSRLWMQPAQ